MANAYGDVVGCFGFMDALRPEVSVSRDELRRLPWSLESVANLAWRRAVRTHSHSEVTLGRLSLFSLDNFVLPLLRDVMGDPLLKAADGWPREEMISSVDGYVSLQQLRHGRGSVELEPGSLWSTGRARFSDVCAAALLQLHAVVVWRFDAERRRWSCFAQAVPTPSLEGIEHFPPLYFTPYEGSELLRASDLGVNLRHAFAQWLVGAAARLDYAYPGILRSLRTLLLWSYRRVEFDRAGEIAAVLDRLRKLDPELAPPRRLYPKPEDFED